MHCTYICVNTMIPRGHVILYSLPKNVVRTLVKSFDAGPSQSFHHERTPHMYCTVHSYVAVVSIFFSAVMTQQLTSVSGNDISSIDVHLKVLQWFCFRQVNVGDQLVTVNGEELSKLSPKECE